MRARKNCVNVIMPFFLVFQAHAEVRDFASRCSNNSNIPLKPCSRQISIARFVNGNATLNPQNLANLDTSGTTDRIHIDRPNEYHNRETKCNLKDATRVQSTDKKNTILHTYNIIASKSITSYYVDVALKFDIKKKKRIVYNRDVAINIVGRHTTA